LSLPARRPWVPVTVVTVSGLCSLIYQVVWERMLRYNFGGDSIAAAIVTGTFLLGLGLGAFLFADWRRRPARWYATVEAAIGLYGLVSFPILTGLAAALGHPFATPTSAAAGLRPAVVVASIVFLLPPCVLIGGTGPLMFNCVIRPAGYRVSTVGVFYGMNTADAALGVLAAPFLLLNRFSLPVTLALIGAANLLLAVAIWRHGAAAAEPTDARETTADAVALGVPAWILGLACLSGLVSLAFEVTLFRALFVLNPSSPYNVPAVLVPFLLAIAVGSAVFPRFRGDDRAEALRRVGLLFAAGAGAMLLAVAVSGGLSLRSYRGVGLSPAAGAVVVHATLLAASLPLFLGAVLPLLMRVVAATGRELPARAGWLYLANALGAFTGALLTQFVGFPALGTRGVLVAPFELSLGAGGLCLWRAGTRRWAPALLAAVALGPWLVPDAVWRAYAWG
jgi:spermidine synthase